MAEKRGKKRPFRLQEFKEEEAIVENGAESGSRVFELQIARARLRKRWELASVLNFLQVFRPLIHDDLKVSGEQIEEGLIRPNSVLASIHVALLKGIPPVSKNLAIAGAWVTSLCKKIDEWWPWVAEGDLPLVANHGLEIEAYKHFDPTTRLMILKALCEIRAEQDDIVQYIGEKLKSGSPLSTFRKDTIGTGAKGATYWFDGDQDLGYRLYREIHLVDPKQRPKENGSSAEPTVDFLWQTLATDTEEFRDISVRLSDSRNREESVVGKIVKSDIMPVIEKLQKKKERALKQQQRETMLLACSFGGEIGSRRSCRDRRPAIYTFDDFDRSISEAIKMENEPNAEGISKDSSKRRDIVGNDISLASKERNTDSGCNNIADDGCNMNLDENDDNYNKKKDNNDDDSDSNFELDDSDDESDLSSEKKNTNFATHGNHRPDHKQRCSKVIQVEGLRRSTRNTCISNPLDAKTIDHVEMKRRLRERPSLNFDCETHVIPDSEDENESGKEQSFPSADNRLMIKS